MDIGQSAESGDSGLELRRAFLQMERLAAEAQTALLAEQYELAEILLTRVLAICAQAVAMQERMTE